MSENEKLETASRASHILTELNELEAYINWKLNSDKDKLLTRISEIRAKASLLEKEAKEPKLSPTFGTFTDPRDGRTYRTVKIGRQIWLAENLAFAYAGGKCYNNDLANEAKYGRLYDWETAKKAVPPGWHLPTKGEWDELQTLVDKSKLGYHLKSRTGWNKEDNGDDLLGFSALPGGYGYSDGSFYNVGNGGFWWSASENDSYNAYRQFMYYGSEGAFWDIILKSSLFSVRCLQDCVM